MLQEQEVRRRRQLSSRRSFNLGGIGETDDRGWTLLHVGARKGDLKVVFFSYLIVTTIIIVWLCMSISIACIFMLGCDLGRI
ncbi:hypothetical protein KSP40_PGU019411 [Platanthera guangdongensis]|uniref:Uncharacterized protein n=1 Tax=Platanthera guangdongensis TaxID=2320717 RepID=A0ABR2MN21_9ASPA